KVSVIVTYGVDTNATLSLDEFSIFPTFRTLPPGTRTHISTHFNNASEPKILINGVAATNDSVLSIRHKGVMQINGRIGDTIHWSRQIFPSTDKPAIIEMISFTNVSIVTRSVGNATDVTVELQDTPKNVRAGITNSLDGPYVMSARVLDAGKRTLKPGESATFVRVISARREVDPELVIDANAELKARTDLVESYLDKLQLVTPDKVLNTAFAFAKIRTTESIILTKGGLMHAPGGGRYYAAIWANDQGEYGPPFFPFLGDDTGNGAASNAFRIYTTYTNANYKPIPSSIVAEGVTNWHGAGDRGDMAMIAYGATRYALASGDRNLAAQEWPLIEWCLEYCHRKIDTNGVVASDADELENRFPSGKANLCTSSLYYDALNSAVYLGMELGKPRTQLDKYSLEAMTMREAIEKFFGAEVEGFHTYRYFDKSVPSVNARALARHAHYANEPDHLRAWICIPLTVGIYDRKDGTIAALFSTNLWTPDGLATEAGDKVFWDRSTLYALRGVFAVGETEKALNYLQYYSARRLLGEHVPYPVEAYPEGNQSHLGAESALYCRIYTEGLFGIRPTGLSSFNCTPRLPKDWPSMALKHVHAFGSDFNLVVIRAGDKLKVEIFKHDALFKSLEIPDGGTVAIELK
ncbi:MAG TPA: hypothetical protein VN516_07230, partial [Candidatus Baltobacteraceae bacterium]|nr:hypothetical protein [Candidatus Baltobacteraceae bacterium]